VVEWFQNYYFACIGVGVLIWKFIMGNPSNFEGGISNWTPVNITLGQVIMEVQLASIIGDEQFYQCCYI
jgi:hypothetical protein